LKEKLYFATDSSVILSKSQAALDEVIAALADTDAPVEIVGHTDSTGSPEHNLVLSKNRANSVLLYLKAYGIKNTLVSVGKGSTQPIDLNSTAKGRSANRRVEFLLVGE